ncbi:hypothetical protein K523DRAFT_359270 [Schizophyllum commune Tattone D]|nr:hypothetical protein K523DRAFT_359270 [Schizophyllum commune Tattone D]
MPFRSPVRFLLLAIFDCRPHVVTPPYQCPALDHLLDDGRLEPRTVSHPRRSQQPCLLFPGEERAANEARAGLQDLFRSLHKAKKNRILTPNAPRFARGPLADGCGFRRGEWVSKVFCPLQKAKKLHFDTKCAEVRAGAPSGRTRGLAGSRGRGAKRRRVVVFRAKYCTLPAVSPTALSAAGDAHAGL